MNVEMDKTVAYGDERFKAKTRHALSDEMGSYFVECGWAHEVGEIGPHVALEAHDLTIKLQSEAK